MTPTQAKRKLVDLINSPRNVVRVATRCAGEQVRATAARRDAVEVEPSPDGIGFLVRYTGRE